MGTFCVEEYLHCVRRLLALQALFLLRRLLPLAETSSGVSLPGTSSSSSLPLGGRRDLRVHLVFCLGGLPPLALDLGRARGVEVPLGFRLGRAGALPLLLLLLLQEQAKWELPARCRLPFPTPPTSLFLSNSHRMFHDVRIRGRLRSLATACYPPVVLDLRIVEHGRIRGPGHVGVARGCHCGCRSRSSSRSRSRGRGRRLQLSFAWLSSRVRSRRVRSRFSDRYRSRRGGSRSRCDRSRSLNRYRAHRDRLWRDRWWSVDRSQSRHRRTRFPCPLGRSA